MYSICLSPSRLPLDARRVVTMHAEAATEEMNGSAKRLRRAWEVQLRKHGIERESFVCGMAAWVDGEMV